MKNKQKFKKNRNLFLYLTVFIWIIFVIYKWISSHASILISLLYPYGIHSTISALQPVIFPALITLLLYLYILIFKKTSKLKVSYSWFFVVLVFLFFVIIIFNISAFSRVAFPNLDNFLDIENWKQYNWIFIKKTSLLVCWLLLFSLSIYLLGGKIYRHLSSKVIASDTTIKNIVIFSLGIGSWTIALFILGYLKILSAMALLILFTITLLSEWGLFKKIIKNVFSLKKAEINLKDISLLFLWISIFFISSNFIDALRQMPIGFDASTEYLNRAKLISESGALVPGYFPFAYSLISSAGLFFSESASLAIGSNIIYMILSYLAIVYFTHKITGHKKIGIITATVWLSMPMTNEFLLKDAKVEPLLFLTSSISIILFYLWTKNINDKKLLNLSFLFLGLSFSVKITTIILILSITAYYLFITITENKKKYLKLKHSFVALLFFITPILPWTFLSLSTYEYGGLEKNINIFKSHSEEALNLDKNNFLKIGIDRDLCSFTGYDEDIKKFKSKHPNVLGKIIFLPWELSIENKNMKKPMTEIGFLYIMIAPLFIMILIIKIYTKKLRSKEIFLLSTASIYWLIWLITANGMIWYGFPGFFIICAILALTLKHFRGSAVYKVLILSTIFMTTIFLSIQTARFANSFLLQNIAKNIEFRKETFEPIIKEIGDSKYILSTASQSVYYIENNDQRLIKDHYLDLFNCIDYKKNDEETLLNLRELGIEYIIYNSGISTLKGGSRKDKVDRFLNFSEKNLETKIKRLDHTLFYVPR